MADIKAKITMTLGSQLTEQPDIGSAMITEKDGYLFGWYRTNAKDHEGEWVMASVKEDRFHDWPDFGLSGHNILVVFSAPPPRRARRA